MDHSRRAQARTAGQHCAPRVLQSAFPARTADQAARSGSAAFCHGGVPPKGAASKRVTPPSK
eukprot:688746-Alexandrium_andersonii.AAC.1